MVNFNGNDVAKIEKQTYISHIIKLLSLTQLNKVLSIEKKLCELEVICFYTFSHLKHQKTFNKKAHY
jgi:hypothetical protein